MKKTPDIEKKPEIRKLPDIRKSPEKKKMPDMKRFLQSGEDDILKLPYIAVAAAALGLVFILLAGGTLMRGFSESKEAAEATQVQGIVENEAGTDSAAQASESTEAAVTASAEPNSAAASADAAGSAAAYAEGGENGGSVNLVKSAARNVRERTAQIMEASQTVSVTVSAAGDCTLGTDAGADYDSSFNAMYDEREEPSWFLANVRDVFANDDLTIVNFEGVLTEGGERKDKTFCFKGRPEFASVLTEGSVEAANLANNHSFDYGEDSYYEGKEILLDAGVQVFGYDNSIVLDVNGIRVGLTGTFELDEELDIKPKMLAEIEKVKADGAQLVISSFHWGDEGERYQNSIQEELAHAAIDAGADLVIGHHPHVLQPMEIYNGKYIFYSLGNFCFGGNADPADKDTAIAQQTFTFSSGGELLEASEARVIPCCISSTQEYNNYQPTPYEEGSEEYRRVMNKLNPVSEEDSGEDGESEDASGEDYEESEYDSEEDGGETEYDSEEDGGEPEYDSYEESEDE